MRKIDHGAPPDWPDAPDAGSYAGRTIGENLTLAELRRGVQMVFQDSFASLNPRLTCRDSIAFGPEVHGMPAAEAGALHAS